MAETLWNGERKLRLQDPLFVALILVLTLIPTPIPIFMTLMEGTVGAICGQQLVGRHTSVLEQLLSLSPGMSQPETHTITLLSLSQGQGQP